MNDVKFIRDTLYDFKKRHSCKIKIVQVLSQQQSNFTGKRTLLKKSCTVKKAIELPRSLERKFIQDIAYLAANKNFTYGALNDLKIRTFVFDLRDLPKDYVANLNHYVVLKGKRFDISKIDEIDNVALIYICKEHFVEDNTQTDYDPGVEIPVIDGTVEEILSFEFSFGDAPQAVFTVPAAGVIIETSLTYRTAFNATDSIVTVGHNLDPTALLKSNESNPNEAYEFSVDNDLRVAEGDTVTLTITPNSATSGTGILTFKISYD